MSIRIEAHGSLIVPRVVGHATDFPEHPDPLAGGPLNCAKLDSMTSGHCATRGWTGLTMSDSNRVCMRHMSTSHGGRGGSIVFMLERTEKGLPMQQAGEPEEVASAVMYLVSDAASYVSRANLAVAGAR